MKMHQLREYMKVVDGDHAKEEEIYEHLWWGLCKLEHHDEDDFDKMMMKVHCVVYGPHFDEPMAKMAVSHMHNVDGSTGEHWTWEQTTGVANQYGIKHYADWYYALNMLHSDLSNVMGGDANTYAKMAKALYFDDPDMPEGKLFKQWLAVNKK